MTTNYSDPILSSSVLSQKLKTFKLSQSDLSRDCFVKPTIINISRITKHIFSPTFHDNAQSFSRWYLGTADGLRNSARGGRGFEFTSRCVTLGEGEISEQHFRVAIKFFQHHPDGRWKTAPAAPAAHVYNQLIWSLREEFCLKFKWKNQYWIN